MQTYPTENFEIIIVDDSTDDTFDKILKFSAGLKKLLTERPATDCSVYFIDHFSMLHAHAHLLHSLSVNFHMMFGLAVDVNYCGNPFVETRDDIRALNTVLKNAALLMNEPVLVYEYDRKSIFDKVFDKVKTN
jgi:glycosyltransferase involved in cell wall biosynthesis